MTATKVKNRTIIEDNYGWGPKEVINEPSGGGAVTNKPPGRDVLPTRRYGEKEIVKVEKERIKYEYNKKKEEPLNPFMTKPEEERKKEKPEYFFTSKSPIKELDKTTQLLADLRRIQKEQEKNKMKKEEGEDFSDKA
ncbi:MAG: hypothetical protein N3G80_00775 [Candidatus Micrarchaeota archaeon]|nr:hypothetical protein [Candidatus Micrarchaeota archaeon]